ncbi:unnamed protein product [Caenorhabditis bovis]|uniref:SCD domain-containing protein n=1 Tax=Caenorhabditis bovis TaxID=2654633 RepID=A0A8S1EC38_9PELO|nr:unnamed protein product [Caenorhabditis bovis]
MSEGEDQSPQRMSTRIQNRVNYLEMSQGERDEPVFRTPTASTRGRKKRVANNDFNDLSQSFGNLSYNTPPKRGRPRGTTLGSARRGPAKKTDDAAAVEHDDKTLFSAVKYGKRIPEAVDNWIQLYDTNYPQAITDLHQFFISICGCKGVLTPQMSATMEFADIIRRMTEDFDEDSVDYPLVQNGQGFKKFRTNLHHFLHTLIEKCKSSLMYDNRLMDGVIQLLTGLADSQVRAFRHTATFAAMKISSALVDVVIELHSVKEKNAKQIETEKAKIKQSGSGNEKLEALLTKKNELEEKTDEVRQMLQYLFRSVFVHRYRDSVPDIRSICIVELGNWMFVYPEHFLEDSYLKYIGWSLYDKIGDVRLRCVRALMPLFEKNGVLDKLELFTNKFKERLVSMVLDKDPEVAMEACHLMRSIYTVFPTLLTVQDCVPIYELIYATNRQLAVAAGMFLNTKVFQTAEKPTKLPNPKNAPLIQDLIQFFIEGECHDHATYLVDSLIDTNPIIRDWATMADMLLNNTNELTELMETKLIDILACSIQQSATGESPVGRVIVKRGAPSTKESREQLDDKIRLTEIMIPAIPNLIMKYISDRDKVVNLITIPLYFQLDMYLAARMQNNLNELMKAVEALVEKHVDDELIDGMALQLRRSAQRVEEEQIDDEDEANFLCSVRRISAFASYMDLGKWDMWDLMLKIVSNYDRVETKRDVCERAITMLFMQLNFDLYNICKEEEHAKQDAIKKLKKRRDQLVRHLQDTLETGASGVEKAYLSMCDVLILFGPRLADSNQKGNFEQLVLRPNEETVRELIAFLKLNAFSTEDLTKLDQQEQIELMHKKRKLVSQFSKLIIYGSIPIENLIHLMQNYVTYYTDFGDIFKNLLCKCREVDFVDTSTALLETLKSMFEQLLSSKKALDPLSDSFNALRDLAKRFASALGSDYNKNRYGVAIVHKSSIDFAFEGFDKNVMTADHDPPKNLFFLEIALEFSSKLIPQDKVAVSKYLNKVYPCALPGKGDWEPYKLYVASLADKKDFDETSSVRSFSTVRSDSTYRSSVPRGRGRGRPARKIVDNF